MKRKPKASQLARDKLWAGQGYINHKAFILQRFFGCLGRQIHQAFILQWFLWFFWSAKSPNLYFTMLFLFFLVSVGLLGLLAKRSRMKDLASDQKNQKNHCKIKVFGTLSRHDTRYDPNLSKVTPK